MTYHLPTCPACDGGDLEFRPAVIAPFIMARLFNLPPRMCRLAQCRSCRFTYFEERFSANEAAKLYAGYRGADYLALRHYFEPWYTEHFNAQLGGEAEMQGRREVYRRAIAAHGGGASISDVLDYGGDRGQLMRGGPGHSYFVHDISGVAPEAGVVALSRNDLAGRFFDLVLLCEVLEHVSEPFQVLQDAASFVAAGGLLYVTVPNAEIRFTDIPSGAWYQRYLSFVLKSLKLVQFLDFVSTAAKIKLHRIPPFGFAKLHEHINVFDFTSLATMLRRVGLDVVVCDAYGNGSGVLALCRKTASSVKLKS